MLFRSNVMRFLRSMQVGNWGFGSSIFGKPGFGILRFRHGVLQPPRSNLVSRTQLFSVRNLKPLAQAENLEQLSSPARHGVTTVRKAMYGR